MVFTIIGSILITQIFGLVWGYKSGVILLGGLVGAGIGYWAALLEDKRYEQEKHRLLQKD